VSAARYVERLVDAGSEIGLPEVTGGSWPSALYRVRDRGGIGVIALPAAALTEAQNRALLEFRFAQYLAAGFVDPELAYRHRIKREPLTEPEPATVNCFAYSSRDGRLLAYIALRAPAAAPPGTTLRSRRRPLLPLEEHCGWGALNRLRLVPDVPLDRIRELGRFVKNHHAGVDAGLVARAVMEVCVCGVHVLTGPLRGSVDAFVGEFEDVVARRHLEFLRAPFVMLRGGLPAFDAGHFLAPALDRRARYPFAGWVTDLQAITGRLDAIETALSISGDGALKALVELHDTATEVPPSSVAPPDGVPSLADTALPQRETGLEDRLRARARGRRLHRFHPFAGLSETEATTLYTLLDEVTVPSGARAVARGSRSDSLYLIDGGDAEVRTPADARALGPGDLFGEIGLLTGRPRSADVVARSTLRLLRVGRDTFERHLEPLPEVRDELRRLALSRAATRLEPAA
jgi:Cyclic nucleotide-binding domain